MQSATNFKRSQTMLLREKNFYCSLVPKSARDGQIVREISSFYAPDAGDVRKLKVLQFVGQLTKFNLLPSHNFTQSYKTFYNFSASHYNCPTTRTIALTRQGSKTFVGTRTSHPTTFHATSHGQAIWQQDWRALHQRRASCCCC